ncbi:MAG: hypothetical protein HRU40_20820 [Saprospiraceae bacterium]|nr:hypothetical protein [Saprospiraceae bacterium]
MKPKERFIPELSKRVLAKNLHLARPSRVRRHHRTEGRDWPARAYTMIGLKRLNNIEFCLRRVLEEKIPGDVIETGVWKGGAVILMRAVLSAYGDRDRKVWVADSFAGLPKPRPKQYP